jgi:hypothetical protein
MSPMVQRSGQKISSNVAIGNIGHSSRTASSKSRCGPRGNSLDGSPVPMFINQLDRTRPSGNNSASTRARSKPDKRAERQH